MAIDQRLQMARLREHLNAIHDLTAGRARIRKADLEAVHGHTNAARAHLTSLEIAAGYRPIGAALVDETIKAHVGPWWCPGCSRAFASTLATNHGQPACPTCGGELEEQGAGDDDPDA